MNRSEFFQLLRRFVKVWQLSNSMDEVARRLKVDKSKVRVWRLKCVRHKVDLKEMPKTLVGKRETPPTLLKKHWKKLRVAAKSAKITKTLRDESPV